jgi:hypothetical protein
LAPVKIGRPIRGHPSIPNISSGGNPDVSCSVGIGPRRFAAEYEDFGASDDYVVARAWARW